MNIRKIKAEDKSRVFSGRVAMMVFYFSLRVPVGKYPLLSRHFSLLNRDFLEIFNTFCASWHLFHTCAGARVIGGSDLSEVYARRVRCVRTSAASVPIVLLRPPPATADSPVGARPSASATVGDRPNDGSAPVRSVTRSVRGSVSSEH